MEGRLAMLVSPSSYLNPDEGNSPLPYPSKYAPGRMRWL
ncbi:hypothetical protein PBI_LAMBO_17 [Gordonia phage Lambo]|uniref:Uncharacterized protein n=15 Tax=Lambovirus TaxID=2843412 RepID=A0A9E7U2V4_9CAUD|nr:hypothetical protein HWC68_gp18 [Gordonia phage Gibbin]YP_009852469.1 hypothetical protein HWC69_gp017 [Gordonia phage Ranch]YP_009852570.1 hypothetical protein HWC70_gp17 [Gordonia phage Lambo]YP_009852668.1 hypothetical protein HWC71_gp17 [Gordonia phage Sadboi]YP_009853972.1 hypothetical protein HWC82_gp18 [Gordonia phage Yikes]QFG08236.1 hypothetical protein PBI_GRETELLYN_17 [Gordonia phage GretelLyn]UJQ86345.1 hypothetical protein WOJTEK_16 [Gordonia phage Wojtek]UVF61616.1 hypotheti